MARHNCIIMSLLAIVLWTHPAMADTIQLYAAGSLGEALTDVAKAYQAKTGNTVAVSYGPSGTLKNELAGGAKADVFASANMEHPPRKARGFFSATDSQP
jgi:molybdate transport system substrate-binding protein